jgi:plasmid stabilization system protein ParE
MKLRWSAEALADLDRLRDFVSPVNPPAAAKIIRTLRAAALLLTQRPRIGRPTDRYAPREVRRIIVGAYEIYYENAPDHILVLSVMHFREDRMLP